MTLKEKNTLILLLYKLQDIYAEKNIDKNTADEQDCEEVEEVQNTINLLRNI